MYFFPTTTKLTEIRAESSLSLESPIGLEDTFEHRKILALKKILSIKVSLL
jgi:hypothetical protein